MQGIEELQQYVDTLIVIPNQNLFRMANERTTWKEAFKMADHVLYMGVRGVTDLMMAPGLVNLDFADIRTVMAEMGKAMMGTGEAEGENRAIRAAEAAISNPLLEDTSMSGARGLLINITGGDDMTLFEVDQAANRIREEVDEDANIIFGSAIDETLAGKYPRLGGRDRHRPRRSRTRPTSHGSSLSAAARRPRRRSRCPLPPLLRPAPQMRRIWAWPRPCARWPMLRSRVRETLAPAVLATRRRSPRRPSPLRRSKPRAHPHRRARATGAQRRRRAGACSREHRASIPPRRPVRWSCPRRPNREAAFSGPSPAGFVA